MLALAMVPVAAAQCAPAKPSKPASWYTQSGTAHLRNAAFDTDDPDHDDNAPSIVGMWHVVFTATTLNGQPAGPGMVVDNSLVVWHQDKTEIMNSGRPPQDGNFCMGVWEKTGTLTYKLNHFAWAGNNYVPGQTPEGVVGAPIGPVQYKESVRLDPDGKHYTGTFTLQQYDTTGGIAITFTGNLKATRVTIDTTVGDLL